MSKHYVMTAAILLCLAFGASVQAQEVHLNEIYASHSGTDDQEFFEIAGTPDLSLDHHMVLVVEGEGTNAGILDRAWDLTGNTMPADGYFVLGDTAVINVDFDLGSDNNIENGPETFYLVNAFDQAGVDAVTGLLGTDLDPDDDGNTPIPAMTELIDIIAMVDSDFGSGDEVFDGADTRGSDGTFFPAGIFRDEGFPRGWAPMFLDFDDVANIDLPRTPGTLNTKCPCQKNIGFRGPGDAELWMFGGDLSTGATNDILLTKAAPGETAVLFVGSSKNPTSLGGGKVVPFPFSTFLVFMVDPYGDILLTGINNGGTGPMTLYAQFVYNDSEQAEGYGFSNAIEIDVLP